MYKYIKNSNIQNNNASNNIKNTHKNNTNAKNNNAISSKNKKITILTLLLTTIILILLIPQVNAQQDERIIINSADWKDVYSGMLYGQLKGQQTYFLTSTRHATIISYSIPKAVDKLTVISSRNVPFVAGYQALLENEGYKEVEELRVRNANQELLSLLPNIDKFIIIDDAYGYNAVSVAPLASMGEYYVLLTNRNNVNQILSLLEDRTVREIIVYGQIDRNLRTALDKYNPITINTGDRFDNNIEIVKKYQEIHTQKFGQTRKQAVLTNGEFIEISIMNGADPVLFIGFANVPEQVREYIDQSDLQVGTLVGNELIGTATFIRRQTGLSVFVKFGQGARTPSGPVAQVEDLDRFPIPRYELEMEIALAMVNTATNNLEVTYYNKAPVSSYFRTISLRLTEDEQAYIIPIETPITFIDTRDYKTIIYPLIDGDDNRINLGDGEKFLDVTAIYGESPRSLEQTLQARVKVSEINILDEADIDIVDASFNPGNSEFYVKIKNTGIVETYTTVELHDIIVEGETFIFGAEQTQRIRPGKTVTFTVPTTMLEADLPDNENVRVIGFYGERENALFKSKEAILLLKISGPDLTIYILIILIILLLILIFIKKKCKHCKKKNPIIRKTCKYCNHKL